MEINKAYERLISLSEITVQTCGVSVNSAGAASGLMQSGQFCQLKLEYWVCLLNSFPTRGSFPIM